MSDLSSQPATLNPLARLGRALADGALAGAGVAAILGAGVLAGLGAVCLVTILRPPAAAMGGLMILLAGAGVGVIVRAAASRSEAQSS